MTFSIVGHCPRTGELGVAISSSSIAVGARCPWLRSRVGAVATQNVTLPALGEAVLDVLEQGEVSPAGALELLRSTSPFFEYRQLAVVDAQGRTALHTGARALGVHHALAGAHCVAAGNLLMSQEVICAMVPAFEQAPGALADRLLAALRAGLEAGGEAGPVRSAALKVTGDVSWPIVDLRVDWSLDDPIGELQSLWLAYEPQMQDYLRRAIDPNSAPSYGVPGDE